MFIKDGKRIDFMDRQIDSMHELENKVYVLKVDPTGFYLKEAESFTLPSKIYGADTMDADVNRWLKTYETRSGNLGILLTGKKGTGKSLTAKALCLKAECPVILINNPYTGNEFNEVISKISQKAVIFVDKFEKVYAKKEHQEGLLPLLDGTYMGKKIFLFTTNQTGNFTGPLNNRPGRIFYKKEYNNMDANVVREIAEDLLENKDYVDELCQVAVAYNCATMDMIISIITECNIHGESPRKSITHLNIQAESSSYTVKVLIPGAIDGYAEASTSDNPLMRSENDFWFRYYIKEDGMLTAKEIYVDYKLNPTSKDKLDVKADGTIVITTAHETDHEGIHEKLNGKECKLIFEPKVVRAYAYF